MSWSALDEASTGLEALVVARPALLREPAVRFALGAADRPLVVEGQALAVGAPLLERVVDAAVAEVVLRPGDEAPAPGTPLRPDEPLLTGAGRALRFDGSGAVLYATPGRRLRVAVGRHPRSVASPVAGVVTSVEAGAIVVRAEGFALPGTLAAGQPADGRLTVAVASPDAELAAGSIDVASAGAILVAGARMDLEALGRARAMGVRGVIVGGLVSRDLRGFQASEERQRAAMHGGPPFAVLVLDGYGKRPIPARTWQLLLAVEGEEVAITATPPLLVLDAATALPRAEAGRVRVAASELAGREGRFLGSAGTMRGAAGLEQDAGRVLLDPLGAEDAPLERLVPLADLERPT